MTRNCSLSGSCITLMRGRIERWYKDGKGGWLCARHYGTFYNKRHPDRGRRWRIKNLEYVNNYQKRYRAARAAKKQQVAII
ncbi:MAG: hypothetical protein WCC17_13850 [Candidatus Nitrosopolaris sp.]